MPEAIVCPVANITRKGRRRRLGAGIFALAAVAGSVVAFDPSFGGRAWRLAFVPVVAFAALCLAQAQANT